MTNDDIIRMAREAGLAVSDVAPEIGFIWCSEEYPIDEEIYRFAELVAATEREACASIEVHLTTPDRDYTTMSPLDAYEAALMDAAMAFREAIRARGEHGSN
jgi:hypothetical protein